MPRPFDLKKVVRNWESCSGLFEDLNFCANVDSVMCKFEGLDF